MPTPPATLRDAAPSLLRTLRRFRPHARGQRRLLVGGTVALFAEVALRLLEPWPLKLVVDAVAPAVVTGRAEPGTARILLVAALATVLVVAARALAAYLMTLCFALAGSRILARVRTELFAHLHTLSMGFHERSRTGDLVARVTSDVGKLQDVLVTAALPLTGNAVTLVGMLAVTAVLDWQLALLVVAVFPVFLTTSLRLSRRIGTVSRGQRTAEGGLASLATESLSQIVVVKSYSLEQRMQETFAHSNARSLSDGVQTKRLSAGLERKTDLLIGLATAVVLYVGARRVLAGALTLGELVVFLSYLKMAFKPMSDVAKYTGRLAAASASGERIVDVLDVAPEVADGPSARRAPRLRGEVCFQDVELSYEPGHPVLSGLSLQVPAGQRVAVVGPSGAGKSTLVSLLTRLRDPERGRVLLDGHDARDLTVGSVRSQVAVVLQESVLFAVSIHDNIAYGAPGHQATAEQVVAAARLAGAHEFIEALPHGYDTVVGERGATLSGGQRQRLAIARAAIRDAAIIVLDEALTGLDGQTEAEVAAALRRLTAQRTTFVVTHDLTAALDADRLVWLERGRVIDDGLPREVLARRRPAPAARRSRTAARTRMPRPTTTTTTAPKAKAPATHAPAAKAASAAKAATVKAAQGAGAAHRPRA